MAPRARTSPRSSSSSKSSSGSSWNRATATQQELSDYAEGRADAKGGYPPQPPAGRPDSAYLAGYRGTRSSSPAPSSSKSSSSSRRSSSSPRRKSSSSSRRSSSRRRPAPVRNAQRRLQAPLQGQATSLLVLFGTAAGVAFLYNLLTYSDTAGTAIDKVAGAVRWLDRPAAIPYRHN